jgi:hypothetical protein
MGLQMIDSGQRKAGRPTHGLGQIDAHQKRSHQTGAAGYGQAVQIVETDAGCFQGFPDHRHDRLDMTAGCQFRNHAAVLAVKIDLGIDHARQDI